MSSSSIGGRGNVSCSGVSFWKYEFSLFELCDYIYADSEASQHMTEQKYLLKTSHPIEDVKKIKRFGKENETLIATAIGTTSIRVKVSEELKNYPLLDFNWCWSQKSSIFWLVQPLSTEIKLHSLTTINFVRNRETHCSFELGKTILNNQLQCMSNPARSQWSRVGKSRRQKAHAFHYVQ